MKKLLVFILAVVLVHAVYGLGCDSDDDCPQATDCASYACIEHECIETAAPYATECSDDGNECTNDICDSGACVHNLMTGMSCAIGICMEGTCEEMDSNCPPKACFVGRDFFGDCEYYPLQCDDGDDTTIDSCDDDTGCIFTPNGIPEFGTVTAGLALIGCCSCILLEEKMRYAEEDDEDEDEEDDDWVRMK